MKLLFLASRSDEVVAADEYESVIRFGGLAPGEVERVRMEVGQFTPLSLHQYDGVILGGSPFTVSDRQKSPTQVRVERELFAVLDEVSARGLPFLGLCYGIGVVTTWGKGKVGTRFGEKTSAVRIELTAQAQGDPLLVGLPQEFMGYVGHKEACETLPPQATLLATSDACPVQLYRFGPSQYVTQFHPEMDAESVIRRMDAYPNSGYFGEHEVDQVKSTIRAADTVASHQILANFVSICGDK